MDFSNLTPEQIEQAKKCASPEERLAFIKENGVELTDEQLENVSAGLSPEFWCGIGWHEWETTGSRKKSTFYVEVEYRCKHCGITEWYPENA